jgi:hypothetical protein
MLICRQHAAIILYDRVDSNMTDWRGRHCGRHPAVLDSCSLKRRRTASPSVREEKRREEGAKNESTYFCEWSAVNGGEVGDEGEECLELYVDTLRNAVVHCLDDCRDRRETVRKAMRRWRDSELSLSLLRATVINLAFVVEQLTKTGLRRCCVCQSSVVIKS